MSSWRRDAVVRVAVALIVLVAVPACGGDDTEGASGTVTVFAAASLTDAFTDLATAFEASRAGVDVVLNLAGSSSLREQILAGAPADVFASADTVTMDQLAGEGALGGEPVVFARNQLELAVPTGNPGGVEGLADLAEPDLLVGLCAAPVPCGRLAREVLAAAGIEPSLDTEEPDVRGLTTKLAAGELDVGLVYHTEVLAADGAVEGIPVPAELGGDTVYPIAVLADAPAPTLAAAFVDFARSDESRTILARHGFSAP